MSVLSSLSLFNLVSVSSPSSLSRILLFYDSLTAHSDCESVILTLSLYFAHHTLIVYFSLSDRLCVSDVILLYLCTVLFSLTKSGDFGLSSVFSPNSTFQSRKFVGKPSYWSPEVSQRKAFNAKSNDIWCLGVTLFMMVCHQYVSICIALKWCLDRVD